MERTQTVKVFFLNFKTVKINKMMLTDNPNAYLCDPSVVRTVSDVNNDYTFACSQGGILQCTRGYHLQCLISASYGNTAGSCGELDTTPYGCGFKQDIRCSQAQCSGEHEGEVEYCTNDQQNTIYTSSPCQDCMSLCQCNMSSPQFYNVADCFGDVNSQACNEESSVSDNVYLPLDIFMKYCYGQPYCTLYLAGDVSNCTDSDQQVNLFYDSIGVTSPDNVSYVAQWEDYSSVIIDQFQNNGCKGAKFKVLALCGTSVTTYSTTNTATGSTSTYNTTSRTSGPSKEGMDALPVLDVVLIILLSIFGLFLIGWFVYKIYQRYLEKQGKQLELMLIDENENTASNIE
eukprot:12881_1